MITGINDSKELSKHISCKCQCKFEGRKHNYHQCWNSNKCWCECKKRHVWEKDYVWNPATCNFENEKNLASIMDDSEITCNEVIESKDEETNFNEKKKPVKWEFLYFACICINYCSIIDSC